MELSFCPEPDNPFNFVLSWDTQLRKTFYFLRAAVRNGYYRESLIGFFLIED